MNIDIEKLAKAVEEKTGETIVEVTVQKRKRLKYHFSNGQCFNCGKFKGNYN